MKKTIFSILLALVCTAGFAQRFTDHLDRGLVAVKTSTGVFLSWRIQAEEYYDVKYNVYCNDSKINTEPLNVSNFTHSGADGTGSYTVKAVVNGVEQSPNTSFKLFSTNVTAAAPAYLAFNLQDVVDRNGHLVFCSCGQNHAVDAQYAQNYVINEASVADLDGDGEVELMVKRINASDANASDPYAFNGEIYSASNTRAFNLIEVYKLNGTRLWWIDCGPNMVSLNSTELNCIGFDWDMDNSAEFLMRGADNMIIHAGDNTKIYVGDPDVNTRVSDTSMNHADPQFSWTKTGNEYLVYLKGVDGKPWISTIAYSDGQKFTPMIYPLLRLENGETMGSAWAEGVEKNAYGHRSSKYFMGAPYLDGKTPSLFLGRGIYTQIKMCTMDLDKSSHTWSQKWTWKCNDKTLKDSWYAQGYHNFVIADVDLDGRDEIVYGSMTIDDNGQGLSTSGLEHGDAMHVGDFDPFRKGMEIFSCNEDEPKYGCNFRDAATAEIIYRYTATGDDGRSMAANVTNRYPGCVLKSARMPGYLSAASATLQHYENGVTDGGLFKSYTPTLTQNFRIFWDGDLLDETMDGTETEGDAAIYKGDQHAAIMTTTGCKLINDTKNNPTFQGDILGDWREELILRSADNKQIRIYTTDIPTEHRIPSLWYDHQYRNGMVTQTLVYNQPPHPSFFVGEMEGITKAPVPLTNEGRTIVTAGSTITHNGQSVLLTEAGDYGINAGGASPSLLVVNAPQLVSGTNGNLNSTTTNAPSSQRKTISLGTSGAKGAFTGNMRLVKQGEGLLKLTAQTNTYTGDTEIWGGSVAFHGTMKNSHVWMNRHTSLHTSGTYSAGLSMEYGAILYPSKATDGTTQSVTTVTVSDLSIKEGSCVEFDFSTNVSDCDQLKITNLEVVTKDWAYGPKYNAPVFRFKNATSLANGRYKIGVVSGTVTGRASDIFVEGVTPAVGSSPVSIHVYDNVLYLVVGPADEEPNASTEPELTETEVWKLDFEESSSNNYEFTTNGATFSQYDLADGSHCLHVGQGGGSGERTANLSFSGNVFNSNYNYKFEFDWGFASANTNSSTSTLLTDNGGTLISISIPSYATSATVYDFNGNEICTLPIDGYAKACPKKLHHFEITSSQDGTYLSIIFDGANVVENVKISDSFQHIKAFNTTLGKAVSHMALDDITLTQYSATLSDKKFMPAAGTYASLVVERTLVTGYNTICLPYATNVEAIAGTGAKLYTLAGGSVATNNGTTTITFETVNDGNIVANTPYVLWCPSACSLPNVDVATAISTVAGSVEGAGWTLQGNYTPHYCTEGKYVIYNNELRKCGSTAYVDGMRGYFIAPSNYSGAPIRIVFGDDDATSISSTATQSGAKAIYGVDGKQRSSMQRGINIIRMSDGTVKKHIIK